MSDSSDENSSVDVFSDHDSNQLSCSSYSFDEESDYEGDEVQEILPYQFEPEYTQEEILQLEAAGNGRHSGDAEDRQQNSDW